MRGRVGGAYHFDLNLTDLVLVQQRIGFFYNAQCCGIGIDYQEFNYPDVSRFIISQDRRFNISFTLAGVGSVLEHPRRASASGRARWGRCEERSDYEL